jgi:5-(carboxyamino)imidazole ribonucleotide mutase
MPKGVPVATVGVDAAENAGLLAAAILALADPSLAAKLGKRREATAQKVASEDDEVKQRASKGL